MASPQLRTDTKVSGAGSAISPTLASGQLANIHTLCDGQPASAAIQCVLEMLSQHLAEQQAEDTPASAALRRITTDQLDKLKDGLRDQPESSLHLVLLPVSAFAAGVLHTIESLVSACASEQLAVLVYGSEKDAELFAEALRCGASGYLVDSTPETLLLEQLLVQLRQLVARVQMENRHRSMSESHKHILHEQQMAKQVFDKVAHDMVDLANVRHWLSPLAVFNGDVLLATPTPSGGLLLLMGDFTGHGLGAAIGAIPLASTFYGMAHKGFAIGDIIKELNKKLHEILPTGLFCCASVLQLDFSNGVAEIWNAGLPDTLVLHAGDRSVEAVPSSALALGILSPQAFTYEGSRFQLEQGDRIYLSSDGLSETENELGEQYGERRIKQVLVDTPVTGSDSGIDAVKRDLENFIGDSDRADDISLVEVVAVSAEEFSGYYQQARTLDFHQPVSWKIDYEFRAESLMHQDPVPLILHSLLEEPGLRQFSGRLFTIVSELFNNALDHGLLGLSSQIKYESMGFAQYYEERQRRLAALADGSVRFSLDYRAGKQQGRLQVDVIDSGEGFDFSNLMADTDQEPALHGRGLALIRSVCESLEFLDRGNHVRAVYSWS